MTKLCRDCRYLKTTYHCYHPSVVTTHVVTGKASCQDALLMRSPAGPCGPEGRQWEPKLPLIRVPLTWRRAWADFWGE
jgi:hypothetical protein